MRAITVCVDMADLLAVTLPYNRHHFDEMMVVTSLADEATAEIARTYNCVRYATNSFYADDALFNKWRALEEGLNYFDRKGWLCLIDPDVLWPKRVKAGVLDSGALLLGNGGMSTVALPGMLQTPRRRMLSDLSQLRERGLPLEEEWPLFPLHPQQREWAGYTQIFHADDPHLGTPPWHQVDWKHAGGADSFFQQKWSADEKLRPPFEVLHLGPAGKNWCGRVTPYLDGRVPDAAIWRLSILHTLIRQRDRNAADPYAAERVQKNPPPRH